MPRTATPPPPPPPPACERDLEGLFQELGLRKYGEEKAQQEDPTVAQGTRRFRTWLGGWVLVLGSLAFMLVSLYAIVLAKLLPPTGWAWLDVLRTDQYFCFLVPLTLAPTTVLGYLNWVAMGFYQAN